MRKRTKRKVWALCNPISMAIEGAAITDAKALDEIRMVELTSIESFRIGRATENDWRVIADMVNLAEWMARNGIGPEVLPVAAAAEAALIASQARFKATGRLGLDGPGLTAVRELEAYLDLQRSSISRSALENAITKVENRIRSAPHDLKVLI